MEKPILTVLQALVGRRNSLSGLRLQGGGRFSFVRFGRLFIILDWSYTLFGHQHQTNCGQFEPDFERDRCILMLAIV